MSEQGRKKAILFDVDDTLYDQTVPFMEAYAEYYGEKPEVPAEVIYPVTRKYSDAVYSQAMAGEMTMEEMHIYRMRKAFEEFGIRITDQEALDFQKIYADRQHHIRMSPLMQDILAFCSGRAELGIITNGPSQHQWDKVKSLQAEKWIPHENIFVSADVGAEKPDRKIFDHAKRAMELEDAEIWFVGDAYALDVEGALNAGWNAVWMNRRGRKIPENMMGQKRENASCVVCVETEEELLDFFRRLLGGNVVCKKV